METEHTLNGEAQALNQQTHKMTWMSSFTQRSGDEFHCFQPQSPNIETETRTTPRGVCAFPKS